METPGHTAESNDTAEYFESYEDLDVHQLLLKDAVRIEAYKNAIFSCTEHFKDKVVMDVGAGTGILSILCAQSGAAMVYAVEASSLANIIPRVAEENNLSDVIKVFNQRVEDVLLPGGAKVDVIVSEWMGFYLLHEGMLDSVLHARDVHMKAGGKLFPEMAKLWCGPCSLPELYDFWDDVAGARMQSVGEVWRQQKNQSPQITEITGGDLLTDPAEICTIDLRSVTSKQLELVSGKFVLPANRDGKYQGLCLWFSCAFPCPEGGPRATVLSTAPGEPRTHWKQAVVMLPRECPVEEGTPLAWELRLQRSAFNSRQYNIEFTELDPEAVTHPLPCRCYMTKCIVMRAFLEEREGGWETGGEDDEDDAPDSSVVRADGNPD